MIGSALFGCILLPKNNCSTFAVSECANSFTRCHKQNEILQAKTEAGIIVTHVVENSFLEL